MKFEYSNLNPSHKRTGDCAVRAIANALGISWESAIMQLAEMSTVTHVMPNERTNTTAFLKSLGWTKHLAGGRKLKDLRFKGTHLVACHHRNKFHLTYVKDGKIIDTWNPELLKVDYYFNPPKES